MAELPQAPRPGLMKFSQQIKIPNPASGGCKVWVHSPGNLEFLKDASDLLCTAYFRIYHLQVTHVDQVEAYVEEGTKRILIVPAPEANDETAQVRPKGRGVYINLSKLLKKAHLEVEKGYRELYPAVIEADTAVGVAVVVDMALEPTRKTEPVKNRKKTIKQNPSN